MYLFLKGSLRRFLTKNKILNERRILMKKMIAILLSFVLMFSVLNAVLPGDVGTAIGLSVSVILNFLGGESAYVSALKTFLNSGKSTAYFKFKTHCVNRGYMYGDPMYDYEVDSISITY